ncbi:hypothetical protein SLEP1_g56185 [Rubroshorea leprosula]|uniref:Uncharacterized protein n=1 Tax=Rubroshorea leprosula TaxID=152421 RepID=A0AAV5MHT5_9ROSI|nr:hypothetical protein SLEP1_g56185 [Rubroshorea leprosula]
MAEFLGSRSESDLKDLIHGIRPGSFPHCCPKNSSISDLYQQEMVQQSR